MERFPGVELEIDQHGAKHVQEMVHQGDLDVGFTIRPVLANAFDVIPIVSDKNVLIASLSHPQMCIRDRSMFYGLRRR